MQVSLNNVNEKMINMLGLLNKTEIQSVENFIKFLLFQKQFNESIDYFTEEQLDVELQKGYDDMSVGNVKSASEVFANIKADYLK